MPAEVVHAVLDEHGCNTQRVRSFPAVAGVYYCMALSLYPEAAYEEVFAAVAQGLAWASGAARARAGGQVSISGLRSEIGAAPLRELVERCCVPMAERSTHPHAFYAGLRLVAMDGSTFELPDEADNAGAFRLPGQPHAAGHAGYPQARCAVLVECATHAILGANLGPYRSGEWELCEPLLRTSGAGHALHGRPGFQRLRALAPGAGHRRADLLWRCAEHPPVAGATRARRRLVPQRHPSQPVSAEPRPTSRPSRCA